PGVTPPQTPPYATTADAYGAPAAAGYAGPGYAAPASYGYPAPGYPVAPPPAPTNVMAVLALIGGIGGLTLLPLLASIAGVVFGHIALTQIRRDPALGGRGMALTGLILGYIGLFFAVLGIIAMIALS